MAFFLAPPRSIWNIKVGYQCQMGRKYPGKDHAAAGKRVVAVSVRVEGAAPASRRTPTNESHGWKIMKEGDLESFLGMSFFHALQKNAVSDETLHFHRKRYFHLIIHTQSQMKPLLT